MIINHLVDDNHPLRGRFANKERSERQDVNKDKRLK